MNATSGVICDEYVLYIILALIPVVARYHTAILNRRQRNAALCCLHHSIGSGAELQAL
jgi:hypothetical protein